MYVITLSVEDRRSMDMAGDAYYEAKDLRSMLCSSPQLAEEPLSWEFCGDVTYFILPETAWKIRDMAEPEENLWPIFDDPLALKMEQFVDKIS